MHANTSAAGRPRASENFIFIAPGIPPQRRCDIELMIELLIGVLDRIDPDPDLEPMLGWNVEGDHGLRTVVDEREVDHDFETLEMQPDRVLASFVRKTGGRIHG